MKIISSAYFPELNLIDLTEENQELLFNKTWQLSANLTRMAFQLESSIDHQLEEILTSAVFPGTVQLNHSGELTILMKDAQTTGGYPRVLQVIDEDLKKLAQKQTGEAIQFSTYSTGLIWMSFY